MNVQAKGELHLEVTYKPFEDDDTDSGYREAEAYALLLQQQAITDVKVSPAAIYLCRTVFGINLHGIAASMYKCTLQKPYTCTALKQA